MRYLAYMARDRYGTFSFVRRLDEAPPQWSGLVLHIVADHAQEAEAERCLQRIEAKQALLSYAADDDSPGVPGGDGQAAPRVRPGAAREKSRYCLGPMTAPSPITK